jgi:hypothetical protein
MDIGEGSTVKHISVLFSAWHLIQVPVLGIHMREQQMNYGISFLGGKGSTANCTVKCYII